MVVTGGRRHALDLYQAIRNYVDLRGYVDRGTLVAFSGQLKDDAGLEFTEVQLNGFSEGQLPDRFGYTKADDPQAVARNQDEYRLLVAAEKYQTGFDQPLLCAMYVDKALTGVTAVQTLSRLNRIHPLKSLDDVHILDFVNQAADIQAAFEDWFETTITEPSDPNLLHTRSPATASGSCGRSAPPPSWNTPAHRPSTTPASRPPPTAAPNFGSSCNCCAARHWRPCSPTQTTRPRRPAWPGRRRSPRRSRQCWWTSTGSTSCTATSSRPT
jgi:hypothetical protein